MLKKPEVWEGNTQKIIPERMFYREKLFTIKHHLLYLMCMLPMFAKAYASLKFDHVRSSTFIKQNIISLIQGS